jgi:hypothetical protein
VIKKEVGNDKYVYNCVVEITHQYLGPAADRFIARQVNNHLKKDPEKITKNDLSHLIDWIRVAVSLFSDDRKLIEEYIEQLQQLAKVTQEAS